MCWVHGCYHGRYTVQLGGPATTVLGMNEVFSKQAQCWEFSQGHIRFPIRRPRDTYIETPWDTLGHLGTPRDTLGHLGTPWDTSGQLRLQGDTFYSFFSWSFVISFFVPQILFHTTYFIFSNFWHHIKHTVASFPLGYLCHYFPICIKPLGPIFILILAGHQKHNYKYCPAYMGETGGLKLVANVVHQVIQKINIILWSRASWTLFPHIWYYMQYIWEYHVDHANFLCGFVHPVRSI